jgi:glycosyltransferase involved in cell wall biosynthesis
VVTFDIDRSDAAVYAGLADRGLRMRILAAPAHAARADLAEHGITVEPFPIRHRFDLRAAARLRRRLYACPPAVVYAPRNAALSVSLMATRGHAVPVIAYRGTTGHLSRWDPASRMSYLHPRLSRIVCVSEAVRRYLRDRMGLPETRLVRIYKGHDPDWYRAEPPARAAFGLADDAFVVGFTGAMRPVKGVDVLLDAVERLAPDLPDLRLLLTGDLRDRRLARRLREPTLREHVCLAGFRADAWKLARLADVFVMPSLSREGLPRAVIEAMAQGVPPVVSDAGGLPELVIDGDSGRVVPAGDAAALAGTLKALAEDPAERQRLGRTARQRIGTDFHVGHTIDAMYALLTGAKGSPGPPLRH